MGAQKGALFRNQDTYPDSLAVELRREFQVPWRLVEQWLVAKQWETEEPRVLQRTDGIPMQEQYMLHLCPNELFPRGGQSKDTGWTSQSIVVVNCSEP